MKEEICENCGEVITEEKQAYLFQNKILCEKCDSLLRNNASSHQPQKINNAKKWKILVILALFISVAICLLVWFKASFIGSVSLRSIQEIPLGESSLDIIISPDGNRVAVFKDNHVVIDGITSTETLSMTQTMNSFVFSPDSQKYAYITGIENDILVIDGVKQPKVNGHCYELTFSPDGQKLAFIAVTTESSYDRKARRKYAIIVNGEIDNLSRLYDQIFSLWFLPASGQLSYIAYLTGKFYMVIGGVPNKGYDNIGEGDPTISPDGKRYAYAAKHGKKWLMVVDGNESAEFDRIGGATFSRDSSRVMFAAMRDDKHYAIIDGKEGVGYDAVDALTFSPDSKKTAYVAKHDNKWLVAVDRIEQKEYDRIMDLAFSPDSRHLAYLANQDEKVFFVMDSVEQKKYDNARLLTFSPDSKRVAFYANVERKNVTLAEDDYETIRVPGRSTGKDIFGFPTFEKDKDEKFPNTKGWEKLNEAAGKMLVVVNGKEEQKYEVVANLTFSPDSKSYVYWAFNGIECNIIINGVKTNSYDSLLSTTDDKLRSFFVGRLISYPTSKFIFDTPSKFHTLAKKNGKIVRIIIELNPN